jgi:hypothetical protein
MYLPFEFLKEERNNEFLKQNKVSKQSVAAYYISEARCMIWLVYWVSEVDSMTRASARVFVNLTF